MKMIDLITLTCARVLEHVVDPLSLLTQLKSLLNPKGIIHISTPNSPNSISLTLVSKTFLKKGPFQPLEHINTFNYKTLNFAATRAGLVPCNPFYVSMKGIYGAGDHLNENSSELLIGISLILNMFYFNILSLDRSRSTISTKYLAIKAGGIGLGEVARCISPKSKKNNVRPDSTCSCGSKLSACDFGVISS